MSRAQVTLQPAEFASWGDARSEMMVELKKPLKAQLQAELAAAPNDEAREEITAAFAAREKALEHDLGAPHPATPTPTHMPPPSTPSSNHACAAPRPQTTSRWTST